MRKYENIWKNMKKNIKRYKKTWEKVEIHEKHEKTW